MHSIVFLFVLQYLKKKWLVVNLLRRNSYWSIFIRSSYFTSTILKLIWELNMNFAKPQLFFLYINKKLELLSQKGLGRHIKMCYIVYYDLRFMNRSCVAIIALRIRSSSLPQFRLPKLSGVLYTWEDSLYGTDHRRPLTV